MNCPPGKILNPLTRRCVLKSGKIGSKIMKENDKNAENKNAENKNAENKNAENKNAENKNIENKNIENNKILILDLLLVILHGIFLFSAFLFFAFLFSAFLFSAFLSFSFIIFDPIFPLFNTHLRVNGFNIFPGGQFILFKICKDKILMLFYSLKNILYY